MVSLFFKKEQMKNVSYHPSVIAIFRRMEDLDFGTIKMALTEEFPPVYLRFHPEGDE